ncbi:MAG: peptide chain release factor N(5)-glutamine methyltransferase [Deltaproteobacteria bacterium]
MHKQTKAGLPDWTLIKLIQWATAYFDRHHIDSPRTTAEILLAHALGAKRIDLYLRYDQPLNSDELNCFKTLIKRRTSREPAAYIVGHKEFWSIDLEVNRNVLIPRPETECLVERALESLAAEPDPGSKSILELGTGSGAVILALASENLRHSYLATDISSDAVEIARRNALRHGLDARIRFMVADWFAPLDAKAGIFDLIASNPPYIRSGDLKRLQPEIYVHEPVTALDGAQDGLRCLRHIIQKAHLYLKPGGALLLEMGHDQQAALKQIIEACGRYEAVRFYKDYSGHDRIVSMRKRP